MNTYTISGVNLDSDGNPTKLAMHDRHASLQVVNRILNHCFGTLTASIIPKPVRDKIDGGVDKIITELVDGSIKQADDGQVVVIKHPFNPVEIVLMTDEVFDRTYANNQAVPEGETIQ